MKYTPPYHVVPATRQVLTSNFSLPPAYGTSLPIQDCTDGYYCDEGAAAALPCPGGTTKRLGVTMTRKEDCDVCGEGTFCPVGSGAATNCSAGTFNDEEKQEACTKCPAGTVQDVEGATACADCHQGHFCKVGASSALPCPGAIQYPFQPLPSGS